MRFHTVCVAGITWTERKLSSRTLWAQMFSTFWHVRSLQCAVQLQEYTSPCGSVSSILCFKFPANLFRLGQWFLRVVFEALASMW